MTHFPSPGLGYVCTLTSGSYADVILRRFAQSLLEPKGWFPAATDDQLRRLIVALLGPRVELEFGY